MSDLYQLRGTEVRAFKVDLMADTPDWFKDAINKGVIYYQGGKYPYFTVEESGYIERASVGDYIVKNDTGHRVVRKDFFERYYEKVPD